MNLVFCGTPQFAVPSLSALLAAGFKVRLVVSQPDRPRGRGMEVAISPVKELAVSVGLPVLQPEKIKHNDEFRAQLTALAPDAIVVVAYGRIIPRWMIDLPRLGNLNLHASLLPRYRGAAPVQWAIAAGETETGVTTMKIDEGLDTGPILMQRELPIAPEDTAVSLAPRLAEMGAELLVETLFGLDSGDIVPEPQDDSIATLAPLLKKEDGRADFSLAARELHNRVRGFQPWPGVYTTFRGRNLHLWKTQVVEHDVSRASRANATQVVEHGFSRALGANANGALAPAQLLVTGGQLLVECGHNTALELLQLQPEGKRRMDARDFIHGYKPKPGERLG